MRVNDVVLALANQTINFHKSDEITQRIYRAPQFRNHKKLGRVPRP